MTPAVDMRREDRLAQLISWIDAMALPMFVLALESGGAVRFLRGNAALQNSLGVPLETHTGRLVRDVFPVRLAARMEAKYRAGFESRTPVSYSEVISIAGRDTYWQTTLSHPEGFGGRVLLGVSLPDTERKTQEFALAHEMAEISARFDELKLFSTMAAHDARSPLATVSSLIDIIKDDFVDFGDGKRALLDLCQDTVTEALTQITATLQHAQTLTLKGRDAVRVDLGPFTGDIAAMVDPEARIHMNLPDGEVVTDAILLQMALRNLMANAARYCDREIAVQLDAHPGEATISIYVADDGPGLPLDCTIADLTQERQGQNKGHGFGLDAISRLAQSRGGSLDIDRAYRPYGLPGAVFRLRVPGQILRPSGRIGAAA